LNLLFKPFIMIAQTEKSGALVSSLFTSYNGFSFVTVASVYNGLAVMFCYPAPKAK